MKYAGRRSFKYGHAFSKWQARYLKDHPEYFGLNPYGRRGVEGAKPHTAKLCLSNDACIDQILANWTAAGTNRFLNVCPNDREGRGVNPPPLSNSQSLQGVNYH